MFALLSLTDTPVAGHAHRDSLFSALHLANTLKTMGQLREAERLLRDALQLAKGAYGEDDPVVASLLNGLGVLLKAGNSLEEAKKCYEKALAIQW